MLGEGDVAPDSSWPLTRAASQCSRTGTAGPDGRREGMALAGSTGTSRRLCPASESRGHSAAKGPPPGAQLSPDCQIQQGLAYPEQLGSSEEQFHQPNYSMDNRFWTNKNNFSLMVQKALQNSTEPWGPLSLGHQSSQ